MKNGLNGVRLWIKNIVARAAQVLVTFILIGVIMFLTAWTVRWLRASMPVTWAMVSADGCPSRKSGCNARNTARAFPGIRRDAPRAAMT